MTLFYRQLESITVADLQALINVESELKTIEYKRELPELAIPDKKREFLADVSSFANAIGGDILYGIDANKGVPTTVTGLAITREQADAEILRLETIVREWIQPRIPVRCQPIQLSNGNLVVIMRIQRSFARPHQVTFQNDNRFYSRSTNGKYRLDVHELRTIFELSATAAERIRDFRTDRLASIIEADTPVPLLDRPKLVLHVVPISAFALGATIEIGTIAKPYNYQEDLLRPLTMYSSDLTLSVNFDGLLRPEPFLNSASDGYVQLFRNGSIEAVDASVLLNDWYNKERGEPYILAEDYEKALVDNLPRYLRALQKLGIEAPLYAMVSLVGIKGCRLVAKSNVRAAPGLPPITKNVLLVPEAEIESFNATPLSVFHQAFLILRNAGGMFS